MRLTYRSPVSRARRDRLARVVWAVAAVASWAVGLWAAILIGRAADGLPLLAMFALTLGAGMFYVLGLVFAYRAAEVGR